MCWQSNLEGVDIVNNEIIVKGKKHYVHGLDNLGLRPVLELCRYRTIYLSRKQVSNICKFPNLLLFDPQKRVNESPLIFLNYIVKKTVNDCQLKIVQNFASIFKEFILVNLMENSENKFSYSPNYQNYKYQLYLVEYYFNKTAEGKKYFDNAFMKQILYNGQDISFRSNTNLDLAETNFDDVTLLIGDEEVKKEKMRTVLERTGSTAHLSRSNEDQKLEERPPPRRSLGQG